MQNKRLWAAFLHTITSCHSYCSFVTQEADDDDDLYVDNASGNITFLGDLEDDHKSTWR